MKQEMNVATRIQAAIDKHAWDGNWYLAGFSDLGNPVGSAQDREGRIFLNSQTWAVMTGLAKDQRKIACLKAIDEILDSQHGSLTLTPAYTAADPNVGRVTMLLPGVYENCTPYCHGTALRVCSRSARRTHRSQHMTSRRGDPQNIDARHAPVFARRGRRGARSEGGGTLSRRHLRGGRRRRGRAGRGPHPVH